MNNKYPLLTELVIRLFNESPSLFKKLQMVFFILAAVVELATLFKAELFPQSAFLDQVLNHVNAAVLLLTALGFKLPVKDDKVLKPNDGQNS